MFACFQKRLYHTFILTQHDTNYNDKMTFTALREKYWESLGRLGKWHNAIRLRKLKGIERIWILYCDVNRSRLNIQRSIPVMKTANMLYITTKVWPVITRTQN